MPQKYAYYITPCYLCKPKICVFIRKRKGISYSSREGLRKAHRRNGFVSLSFPQAPVTLFIILHYFESPATTFGFVKAIRLRALP